MVYLREIITSYAFCTIPSYIPVVLFVRIFVFGDPYWLLKKLLLSILTGLDIRFVNFFAISFKVNISFLNM